MTSILNSTTEVALRHQRKGPFILKPLLRQNRFQNASGRLDAQPERQAALGNLPRFADHLRCVAERALTGVCTPRRERFI
jgi:hypothetical protein